MGSHHMRCGAPKRKTTTANNAMPRNATIEVEIVKISYCGPYSRTIAMPIGKTIAPITAIDGVPLRQGAGGRLRDGLIIEAGEEQRDEAQQVEMGMCRRQPEVRTRAHCHAEDHADQNDDDTDAQQIG